MYALHQGPHDRLQETPNEVGGLIALAEIYRILQRYDEAETTYRRAIELQPWDPNLFIALGDLFLEQDQPEQAIPPYRSAIEQADPASAPGLQALIQARAQCLKNLATVWPPVDQIPDKNDRSISGAVARAVAFDPVEHAQKLAVLSVNVANGVNDIIHSMSIQNIQKAASIATIPATITAQARQITRIAASISAGTKRWRPPALT